MQASTAGSPPKDPACHILLKLLPGAALQNDYSRALFCLNTTYNFFIHEFVKDTQALQCPKCVQLFVKDKGHDDRVTWSISQTRRGMHDSFVVEPSKKLLSLVRFCCFQPAQASNTHNFSQSSAADIGGCAFFTASSSHSLHTCATVKEAINRRRITMLTCL